MISFTLVPFGLAGSPLHCTRSKTGPWPQNEGIGPDFGQIFGRERLFFNLSKILAQNLVTK
ncbi:hypothetical protein [Mameliella sp. MMSF_3510]|uniref:hypothetical protein n=1 Tax=Mameliella sp. MMSF_3510 TaxID=3046718 RepID=UPI00273D9F5E|nr:hypothetical protein [Mameliella sp. MMSF_3510]